MFCNEACKQAASNDPGSHCDPVCSMMKVCNIEGASDEVVSGLGLLCRLCNLLCAACSGNNHQAESRWNVFWQLSCGNEQYIVTNKENKAHFSEVLDRFRHVLLNVSAYVQQMKNMLINDDFIVSLLVRDLVNSYGIRAPISLGNDCGFIRGTAIYSEASRLNHECLPSVARYENIDRRDVTEPGRNLWMEFRALFDIPAGEEVTQSYFPLEWELEDRQMRCREVYGFACACPRCCCESHGEIVNPNNENVDEGYVSIFLIKYLCPDPDCEGTMVPVLDDPEKSLVCNVCSAKRTEVQFMSSLEA